MKPHEVAAGRFLLDGHHNLEAAAKAGRPLRLLSLLAVDAGLADKHDIASLAGHPVRDARRASVAWPFEISC
ncbi:hypothetical protein [Nocardia fluminea]|uniref:Uncharacterized protein n=1 Tax=Nocardia fluminea TaxID=134984 RepID=A0A2N3VLP9_9NOCA|nr:hypothetical protein [Nocardia fluminea]PKV82542.1 hypothetical protein ATK86_7032 [Nocardia fluminea]